MGMVFWVSEWQKIRQGAPVATLPLKRGASWSRNAHKGLRAALERE